MVDMDKAAALRAKIESLPETYTFSDWIRSTAELQTIAYGEDPVDLYNYLAGEPEPEFNPHAFKDFFRWNILAAIAELVELLDEAPWKPWASSTKVDRYAAIGEIVDAMHFIGNLLRLFDVTGDELTERYRSKQLINLDRQLKGYDGKVEKCTYCSRALDDLPDEDKNQIYQFFWGDRRLKFCSKEHAKSWVPPEVTAQTTPQRKKEPMGQITGDDDMLTPEEKASLDEPAWQKDARERQEAKAIQEAGEAAQHVREMTSRVRGVDVHKPLSAASISESPILLGSLISFKSDHLTQKDVDILLSTAHAEEPVIIFRAKDLLANFVLRHYQEQIEAHVSMDSDIHQRVWEKLQTFREWQHDHPESVRFPD